MRGAAVPHDPEADLEDLRRYLGDAFDLDRLHGHEREVLDEHARIGDEATLYRTSEAYLYDLTAFAMSGTKLPYLRDLTALVPPPGPILDYGCGIGSDGLRLLAMGYRVAFADFDNPSTRFLRWRLEQRGIAAPVHDLDAGDPPPDHRAVVCFDVLEHVPDPFALLERLERSAEIVCVNALDEPDGGIEIHRPLPVRAIVRHAARRRLLRYRRYHGRRSHLLLYGREPARGRARLRSAAALAAGLLLRPRVPPPGAAA